MADTEIVDMQITDTGQRCVAALQEVVAQFDLSGPDAAMAVGASLYRNPRNMRRFYHLATPKQPHRGREAMMFIAFLLGTVILERRKPFSGISWSVLPLAVVCVAVDLAVFPVML